MSTIKAATANDAAGTQQQAAAPVVPGYTQQEPALSADGSQRRYSGYGTQRGDIAIDAVSPTNRPTMQTAAEVSVMRFADCDEAKLAIRIMGCDVTASAYLPPNALRTLAFALLDAAHDIKQNPVSSLVKDFDQEVA